LNPSGATQSCAFAVSGGQQVGRAEIGGDLHASLWSGTAASWVDLHPLGATDSQAYGVSGGKQVGHAKIGGNEHAGLWSGTAQSRVDLHALLRGRIYKWSYAHSVDVSAGEIWVAGWATNTSTGKDHAMLWHYTAEASPK
ncbi:MAG: hypothetical protein NTU88_17750, partial [Armatimonadetes bacterium]|nr:hypothetical protein [Armatimonadota bacterium]